jgi:hypothetical protein
MFAGTNWVCSDLSCFMSISQLGCRHANMCCYLAAISIVRTCCVGCLWLWQICAYLSFWLHSTVQCVNTCSRGSANHWLYCRQLWVLVNRPWVDIFYHPICGLLMTCWDEYLGWRLCCDMRAPIRLATYFLQYHVNDVGEYVISPLAVLLVV